MAAVVSPPVAVAVCTPPRISSLSPRVVLSPLGETLGLKAAISECSKKLIRDAAFEFKTKVLIIGGEPKERALVPAPH